MLFLLLLAYTVPLTVLGALVWIVWRTARRRFRAPLAAAVAAVPLLLVAASEAFPASLAERIARRSAEDAANSVGADGILFDSAVSASEALAEGEGPAYAEGPLTDHSARGYGHLPLGPIRFSGARPLEPGQRCRAGEVEEWLPRLEGPVQRRCVGWQRISRWEAPYRRFHNRFVSYRVGPYRVTEQQDGLVRRADGRLFNVAKSVEVTGGLWWHLLDAWFEVTGLIGFGHPGYVSGTFNHLPQGAYGRFPYRGAVGPAERTSR